MADFCKQCSIETFGEDCEDLHDLCDEPMQVSVICEGCGHIQVNHLGECQGGCLIPAHGKREV